MLLVALLGVLDAVSARSSPNADYVVDMLKSPEGHRYSNYSMEDVMLDVPGLIAKYGYPVEVHNVVTSDGYILELHRIPRGREDSAGERIPVLLMHGLLSSSADFLIMGPGNALGYILADAGYDVWLGNARGNYYSRHHTNLNPDSFFNKNFWRFSWDEIGYYDLPACVDFILKTSGQEKLHYIGHSQGGTTFMVLNSLRPQYNEKFISFQGLAPAVYFENNDDSVYNTLSEFESIIETFAYALNAQEIFGKHGFMAKHCVEGSILNKICKNSWESLYNREYYNKTMLPVILAHTPAGAAVRQLVHYGQVIRYKSFRRYYYNALTNIKKYGSISPPEYDLSRVTAPCYLHYGLDDKQVNYRDLLKLAKTLPNVVAVNQAERVTFNHFDFIWAVDAMELIYHGILAAMQDAEQRLN